MSPAVVIATGITAEGNREVLGIDIGDSEDEMFWTKFGSSLNKRGLSGVRPVIPDAHEGLKAAIGKCFQGAIWQRCRVHYSHNLLAKIPKARTEMVAAAFRSIFALTDPAENWARHDEVTDLLDTHGFTKAATSIRSARHDVLAFGTFPRGHWRKIWPDNPLERVNKHVKRRSSVAGIFSDDAAVIRLVGAVLADPHDEWAAARRYLSEASMAELTPSRDTEPPQAELEA